MLGHYKEGWVCKAWVYLQPPNYLQSHRKESC